jgi:hypothetical protein
VLHQQREFLERSERDPQRLIDNNSHCAHQTVARILVTGAAPAENGATALSREPTVSVRPSLSQYASSAQQPNEEQHDRDDQ